MSTAPSALSFESEHVHAVYEEIAADFSRTRHTRWSFVERFLDSLEPGSLVLDAGTGNGKYLGCRSVLRWEGKDAEGSARQSGGTGKGKGKATDDQPTAQETKCRRTGDMLPIGFDMSSGLLAIAKGKGHEVVRGDCVDLRCWRRGAFDHAISIATIHHFATHARRMEAQMILSVLPSSPPTSFDPPHRVSKLLIVVWSVEQDPSIVGGDRSARRTTGGKKGAVPVVGLDGGDGENEVKDKGRDVFVPWERQEVQQKVEKAPKKRRWRGQAGDVDGQTITAPSEPSSSDSTARAPSATPTTFNRYYHLFRHRELTELVMQAADALSLGWEVYDEWSNSSHLAARSPDVQKLVEEKEGWDAFVRIVEERWERENWVVEVEVGWRLERMVAE
ncbi:alkylated DNA repair protein alkB-like protein [Rhodotorula toruloides]|uniref:Alkylated DNA repair protein alkB-like protein n=1 Tax=Rhodotorula toruloides TaxID=5286 RepID=A0A511KGI4_RHOTO|nr:alkylated DNA repair protein alkB-like protein [Rhodotorula toruloides]